MRVHLIELTDAGARRDEALVRMGAARGTSWRRRPAKGVGAGPDARPLPDSQVLSPCALPREELAALGAGRG